MLFHDNKVGKTEGCILIQGSVCSRNSRVAAIHTCVEGAGLHTMQNDSKCSGSALPQSKRNHLVAVTTGIASLAKPSCWPGAALGHHEHCQGPGKARFLLSGGWISSLILPVAGEGLSSAPQEGPDGHRTTHGEEENGLRNDLCSRETPASSAPDKPQPPLLPWSMQRRLPVPAPLQQSGSCGAQRQLCRESPK